MSELGLLSYGIAETWSMFVIIYHTCHPMRRVKASKNQTRVNSRILQETIILKIVFITFSQVYVCGSVLVFAGALEARVLRFLKLKLQVVVVA